MAAFIILFVWDISLLHVQIMRTHMCFCTRCLPHPHSCDGGYKRACSRAQEKGVRFPLSSLGAQLGGASWAFPVSLPVSRGSEVHRHSDLFLTKTKNMVFVRFQTLQT